MSLSERQVRRLMESDAYTNRNNKNYEKVNREVRQGFENLYPDDDRNEHPENYYIWRTKGDDRVRGKHAEREGEVFSWSEPPEGGHPGEDYNCRCWAERYVPPKVEKSEKEGTGSADTEEYMSFGDRALTAMSGVFVISEAKAKEVEYSSNNLLENGKKKKLPPLPARKPEYNPNNKGLFSDKPKSYQDKMINDLIQDEGNPKHLYIDTEGYMTIGIGTNVDNFEDFKKVKWMKNGRPATEDEILQEYNNFKELQRREVYKSNLLHTWYQRYTTLEISDDEMRRLAVNHLNTDIKNLRKDFTDFDEFPEQLQHELLNLKYNINNKLNKEKWPNLYEAIKQKDVKRVAKELHRKKVDESRNKRARDNILSIKPQNGWH